MSQWWQRVRDGGWSVLVWGLPVAALAFGVYKLHERGGLEDRSSVAPGAQARGATRAGSVSDETREPAWSKAKSPQREGVSGATDTASDAATDAAIDAEPVVPRTSLAAARASEVSPRFPTRSSGQAACGTLEWRGRSPESGAPKAQEWAALKRLYHDAKSDVRAWVALHRSVAGAVVADALDARVASIRIQQPPAAEEPDLSWRGIGVYTRDSRGQPLIRTSHGLVALAQKEPVRARFEIARLIAQTLAPCELKQAGVAQGADLWTPVLKCLGMERGHVCESGSYSEAGWATSTTLAAWVSAPGCGIPALDDAQVAACLSSRAPLLAAASSRARLPAAQSEPQSEQKSEAVQRSAQGEKR